MSALKSVDGWRPMGGRTLALATLVATLAACGEDGFEAADGGEGRDSESDAEEDGLDDSSDSNIVPSLTIPSGEHAGTNQKCFEDEVHLTAVTLGDPRPFDLVIVADHSDSLSWSRTQLASGLNDLLESVRDRFVRVFLLTPTQYGATSEAARTPVGGTSVVDWQDQSTGKAYEHAVTRYEQTCTDFDGQAISCPEPGGWEPFVAKGIWHFEMPPPIAEIEPDLSDEAFAAQQLAVKDAILAVGGSGSPTEQPLCTLNRYIKQDPSLLPTNAVFLVISDEDDRSLPESCLVGLSSKLEIKEDIKKSSCDANCDASLYEMESPTKVRAFDFDCAAIDDFGVEVPGTRASHHATGPAVVCDDPQPGPCTAEEQQELGNFCDQGKQLMDCTRTCRDGQRTCQVVVEDQSIDACTQAFVIPEGAFDNVEQYCTFTYPVAWSNCQRSGVNLDVKQKQSGGFIEVPVVRGDETRDLGEAFHDLATTKFGAEAYLVEAIVFDPEFSCSLKAGQSYATNLVDFVGDREFIFPLCESYEPALAGVWAFADTLIETEFPVTIKSNEIITKVFVVARDQRERMLGRGEYQYDRDKQLLTIETSAISANDEKLRIEVSKDCPPP